MRSPKTRIAPSLGLRGVSTLRKALAGKKPRVLFFDIDDTFTSHGQITSEAFNALWRAHDAGIACVAVTGRPAGWCDHIARMWPVAGVVGEKNGACAFWFDKKLRRLDTFTPQQRAQNRKRLAKLGTSILKKVPGTALASDQPYREYDLAIDFLRRRQALPKASVQKIVSLLEAAGATAKVSSIHVNGWFGNYGKKEMALPLRLKKVLGLKKTSTTASTSVIRPTTSRCGKRSELSLGWRGQRAKFFGAI